jgi:hypothetical protein
MNNDQKPGIRIIAERVSITTIRARSENIYCENCRRALSAEEMRFAVSNFERRDHIEIEAAASSSENEKEK